MTSKIAKLQALLYMAGDGGIKKEQLRDLLQMADPEIESLAKRLQEKLASDPDCGLQLLEINDEYKLTTSG
ncbi:SMC-Scp complex subunit ScpB, partial [Streptococcus anginosus]|uniref:SMC-Scp complex subunit ScpB n=1 Tax=Streptococcus anginosus TaxID=1328 RepID=UPI0021F8293D